MKYISIFTLLWMSYCSVARNIDSENIKDYVEINNIINFGNRIERTIIFQDSISMMNFDYSKYKYPELVRKIVLSPKKFKILITYILSVKQEVVLNSTNELHISIQGYKKDVNKRKVTIYGNTIESEHIFDLLCR